MNFEPTIDELDDMTTADLEQGIVEWRRPSDPSAPISNVPCAHSSTMPSCLNYMRINRANAILEFRRLTGTTPEQTPEPRTKRRSSYAFSAKY